MMAQNRLPLVLLFLRLSVFLVMFMWTLQKFIVPQHAAAIYQHFYFISGLSSIMSYAIGAVELIIIIGFLLGFHKRLTYGIVLVLHGISTFSCYKQYVTPFSDHNLLFFTAWPMLAACFALYYLRDHDTLCSLK